MSVPIVQITESATIVCKGEQDQIVTVESWRRRNGDVGVCIKAKFLDGSESREIVIFDPPASKRLLLLSRAHCLRTRLHFMSDHEARRLGDFNRVVQRAAYRFPSYALALGQSMLQLRDYQRDAIDSVYNYWGEHEGSPLIVMPTGGGKSLIIAVFMQELLANYGDMRVLCVTHVKELLSQNFKELVGIWPFAPAGIYSAGLGRRDAHAQIIFGGVATIYNKAKHIGHIDLVLVDEAHLVPRDAETQYGKLFAGLREINPDLKIMGLTATPYRMGEGLLHEGEGAMFDAIAYEKPIGELIDEGFLCRPISKGMTTHYDLTGVGKQAGDYKQGALQAAVDKDDVNSAVAREIVAYGAERRAWLLFCSGVEHAHHMRDEIRALGVTCETIVGDTPNRARILEDFGAGKIRAITNNSILTTGTNVPRIDLLGMCRPTLSPGLYGQMVGRGLRLYPGKKDCLVLDFAGVVRKHGPIDMVTPPSAKTGNGEAPVKECPPELGGCGSLVHASVMTCPDCGYIFPPPEEEEKLTKVAEDLPILSKADPDWRHVAKRSFSFHEGKGDKPPSVKTTYYIGLSPYNEWLCPEHSGFARTKAQRWWQMHNGQRPFPKTVLEWLERQNELNATDEINIEPDGRYWKIVGHRPGFAPIADDVSEEHIQASDNYSFAHIPAHELASLDDDIPF